VFGDVGTDIGDRFNGGGDRELAAEDLGVRGEGSAIEARLWELMVGAK